MITAYKVEFGITNGDYEWSRKNTFFIDSKWSIKDPEIWLLERVHDYCNTLTDGEEIIDIKITKIDNPPVFMLFE